jgi:peptide/nickel transport system ATP-binding protein
MLAINMLGDGLRDTLDPKMARMAELMRGDCDRHPHPRSPEPERAPAGAATAPCRRGHLLTSVPGEIVCVVGESGSGKSVRACADGPAAGTVKPEAGRSCSKARISEARRERLRAAARRRMAMIFQEPMTALNPLCDHRRPDRRDVRGHTELATPKERRAKALNLAKEVRLPDPERITRLSAPALRRPAPARHDRHGAGARAALLIADEPTTALDVTTQAQILKLIRDLQGARHRRAVHHPRFRRGRRDRRPRRGDAARPVVEQGGAPRDPERARSTLHAQMLLASVPSLKAPAARRKRPRPSCSKREARQDLSRALLFGRPRVVHARKDVSLTMRAARRSASSASPARARRRWRAASPG